MKRLSILLIIFFAANGHAIIAQPFKKGTNIAAVGIGFGSSIGGYSGSQTPALSVQYERGIWPVKDFGVVSLGGYAGFKSFSDKYTSSFYSYSQKWKYTIIGVRSAFHYTGLKNDKIDVYAGAMISYNILKYSYKEEGGSSTIYDNGNYGSAAGITAYAGARYFFKPNLAVFAELGYGVSYLNTGIAFKF